MLLTVGFQGPVKLTEMTSWSTKKKDQQTASPCSHLPSLFGEKFRHCPSSLERNLKK